MKIINVADNIPIVNHYMAFLRSIEHQKDRLRFGETIRNLGRILAIEASKYLEYESTNVITPFGKTQLDIVKLQPILFAIVRAGIKLQEGVADIFTLAQLGFCICPKNEKGEREAKLFAPCNTHDQYVIISDPIMTTGSSMIHTIDAIKLNGTPRKIILLNVISTELAIKTLTEKGLDDSILITCSIDGFVKGVRGTIPGLGDAGDLIYG